MYGSVAVDESRVKAATEADNRMVWDRHAAGHYEVWYLTCNHRASKTGFWIRYTLEAPKAGQGDPYAQLWFAYFDRAEPARSFSMNRRFPIGELVTGVEPFSVGIADAMLTHQSMKGSLEGNGHKARWDLTWLPSQSTHRHLPDVIYKTGFADTKVLSPNLDVPVRGTIEIDGRKLVLDGDPGGQTHVWGRKHAHTWAWGHCNGFDARRGAALEALTVRLKRRGVVLPALTLFTLYLDGEALQFTGFKDTLLTRGKYGTGSYTFSGANLTTKVEGVFTCRPEDMTTATYHDPDGDPAYCANTCAGDLQVSVSRRKRLGAWQSQVKLVAEGTAHFEVGARTPDPAIARRHETLGS
jgi:hypothetical protein